MSFYQIVTMSHTGTAILLLTLALISVLLAVMIAVKPAADSANAKLLSRANSVGLIETIAAGFVTLTGIIAMFMADWPLSELWLWLSLLIMIFYMTMLKRVTKPKRQIVSVGGSEIKSGMQVVLHIGHFLLLLVTYSMMLLKPV